MNMRAGKAEAVFRVLCCVLVLSAFGSAEAAAHDGHLRIGRDDWCPYVCDPDRNNGLEGYAAEVIQKIYEQAGYSIEFVNVNYSRGIEMVLRGENDIMFCMYREDGPGLVYPEVPVGLSENRFYVKKGNPWRFSGPESLEGVKVGLIQSYKYPAFQGYINAYPSSFVHVKGDAPLVRNLEMLMLGRLDAIYGDSHVVARQAARLGISDMISDAGTFGVKNEVVIGFAPDSSRTPELIRLFEAGIARMRRSGELDTILKKYDMKDWKQ